MPDKKFLALDLGSNLSRAVVGEINEQNELVVDSIKETKTYGIQHGIITNLNDFQKTVNNLIRDLKNDIDQVPTSAFVAISGRNLEYIHASGIHSLGDDKSIITVEDISKAHESAKSSIQLKYGRYIIHTIIEEYIINNTPKIKNPLNLPGNRIDAKILMLTSSQESKDSYVTALKSCGIDVDKFCFSTLCATSTLIGEDQKQSGCIIIDIGNDESNMLAYQGGKIVFAGQVPFGSLNVTLDLQYILQKSLDDAQRIKEDCAVAYLPLVDSDSMVEIPGSGTVETIRIPQSEISQIVSARYAEILIMLKEKLINSNKFSLFAHGIYLIGGGAHQKGLAELISEIFNLPVYIGVPGNIKGVPRECIDPAYVNCLGLLKYNLDEILSINPSNDVGLNNNNSISKKSSKGKLKDFISKLF